MLDKEGLSKVYTHNMENPPKLAESLLIELRQTHQFITWQQELWLTHCNDFMNYKGIWEPLDFYKNSKTGDGRDLILSGRLLISSSSRSFKDSLIECLVLKP